MTMQTFNCYRDYEKTEWLGVIKAISFRVAEEQAKNRWGFVPFISLAF